MSSITLPHVIGNWKMNLDIETAMEIAQSCARIANDVLDQVEVGVAVPYPWIPAISSEVYDSNLLVGAQDVSPHKEGAYTGDVSAGMLAPWCAFTLVGHSERRHGHGETNDLVRAKLDATIGNQMAAVLCVGETQEERDLGDALEVVTEQVMQAAGHLSGQQVASRLLVAYEPVWAIGTGVHAEPGDAQTMAAHIRSLLAEIAPDAAAKVPILYGGSVNAKNAADFLAEEDIDGALVGGASIDTDQFVQIVRDAIENGRAELA